MFNFRQIHTLVLVTKHAIPNFKNEYLLIYVCSRMHSSSVGKSVTARYYRDISPIIIKRLEFIIIPYYIHLNLWSNFWSKIMSQYYQATTLSRFSFNRPSHIPLFFFKKRFFIVIVPSPDKLLVQPSFVYQCIKSVSYSVYQDTFKNWIQWLKACIPNIVEYFITIDTMFIWIY